MRIRDRSSTSLVTMLHGWFDRPSGNWWSGYPASITGTLHQIDTMTDVVTPQFGTRRKCGEIVMNPMSKLLISQTCALSGTLLSWNPESDSGYRISGGPATLLPPDPLGRTTLQRIVEERTRCETIATTAAYAGVGSPTANSLVSIGELRETLGFIASPIFAMVKLTKRVKRYESTLRRDDERYAARIHRWSLLVSKGKITRKPEKVKRSFKIGKFEVTDLSSLWLSYRYGLMPLIYDVQDHLAAFRKKAAEGPQRETSRSTFKSTLNIDEPQDIYGPGTTGDYYVLTGNVQYSIKSRAGVLYVPKIESTMDTFGLTLDRVPSTLWELVPLSFVADWALNVSDLLNALTVHFRSSRILCAWVTTTIEWQYLRKRTMTATTGGSSGILTFREVGKHVIRRPVSLADVGLNLRVHMTDKRWVDALSLVHLFTSSRK